MKTSGQFYYIAERLSQGNHAGNKARRDVETILVKSWGTSIGKYIPMKFNSVIDKIKYVLSPSIWRISPCVSIVVSET